MQPLLDVILFTRSLAAVMGYRGQMGLYSYYLLAALVLRAAEPTPGPHDCPGGRAVQATSARRTRWAVWLTGVQKGYCHENNKCLLVLE